MMDDEPVRATDRAFVKAYANLIEATAKALLDHAAAADRIAEDTPATADGGAVAEAKAPGPRFSETLWRIETTLKRLNATNDDTLEDEAAARALRGAIEDALARLPRRPG